MEMEYRDNSRRGRIIIILGILLALIAGGTSFFLINQAQQQAGQAPLEKVTVVIAAREIAPRTPIQAADLETRQIPLDAVTQSGVVTKPESLIGAVLAIPVSAGQPIYANMVASSSGAGFSILGPNETVCPTCENWRAVSLTIPPDRAVAGLLQVGQTVDIIMSAAMPQPNASVDPNGLYIADQSTKVTFQNVVILARVGDSYIFRCNLEVAEEIEHMLVTGVESFSAVLRPDQDVRFVDASKLGETTNKILQKYGLPFPQVFFRPGYTIPPQPPYSTPTPPPTPAASVEASPGASVAPSP
jgi:Flp pilus assembly protein CpaB